MEQEEKQQLRYTYCDYMADVEKLLKLMADSIKQLKEIFGIIEDNHS